MRSGPMRLWRELRDAVSIAVPFFVMIGVASYLNAGEWLHAVLERYEFLQFDEFFVAGLAAAILYFLLLVRRTRRLRRELRGRRLAEHQARQLACHDALTGLCNRRALIEQMHAMARPGDSEVSVLLIDLDRFKPINDTYGHESGDIVLRTIADRLRKLTEGSGTVARMGGDEFACLIQHPAGSEEPELLARRVLAAIAKPVAVRGGMAEVGGSIGVATCRDHDCTPEQLLRSADFAMYRAKRNGRSTYCVFAPDMDEEMRDVAQLEMDMRSGINRGEFVPYYQPIIDLGTGGVVGFEALARWQHPTRGLISPTRFIPIAEEAGLIQDLSFALLRRACTDARAWPRHMTLSFNISPLQLNDSWLAHRILQVLLTTGFTPGRLIVEITESRLVGDLEGARAILVSLKNAGVQIALDDFGTGYASLKHLRELAFNRIKIDRAFVQDIDSAENGQIVRAILNLSDGLGLPVTAEGVETEDNADTLAALGCAYGQGFLFSRPVAAAEALKIATEGHFPPHAGIGSRDRRDRLVRMCGTQASLGS